MKWSDDATQSSGWAHSLLFVFGFLLQFPLPEEDDSAEGVEDLTPADGAAPRPGAFMANGELRGEAEDELEALLYRRPFNTRLLTIHSNACLGSSAGPTSGLISGPTGNIEVLSGLNNASNDGTDRALTSSRFIFTGSNSGGMPTLGSRPPSVPAMDRVPASRKNSGPSSPGLSFSGPPRLHCKAVGATAGEVEPLVAFAAGKCAAGSVIKAQMDRRSTAVSRTTH